MFEHGPTIDDHFHSKVGLFLEEVELFIALLDNVRELPDTGAWADDRAAATYQMLDFIRRIGRDGLYIRFVHQLKDIFLQDKNWLSAGLTLKLHADMYEWKVDGDRLDECSEGGLELPAQTQFERKEAIYHHCLQYYGKSVGRLPLVTDNLANACSRGSSIRTLPWTGRGTGGPASSEDLERQQVVGTCGLPGQAVGTVRQHPPAKARVLPRGGQYFCGQSSLELIGNQAFYGEYRPTMNQGKEYIIRGEPWQQFSDL